MNRKIFFDIVRDELHGGKLNQGQVEGYNIILDEFDQAKLDLRWCAYILATAYHETAFTIQPVVEYGGEKYLRSKPYWPYVGRGYVQLTWKVNYEKYGIADEPEKALVPGIAVYILIDGMMTGAFTGRKLKEFFNDKKTDWINARRIINGTDRARDIASYAQKFLKALEKGIEG